MKPTAHKKKYVGFLILLLLVSSFSVISFPRQSDAVVPGLPSLVYDPINNILHSLVAASTVALHLKGFTLDPIAWAVAKAALASVVKSTVNSVNKGPNGAPQFVTNLSSTLSATANAQADQFLQQLASNSGLSSPFKNIVASAVSSGFNLNQNGGFFAANPYTLNKVAVNDVAFRTDFRQGGFNAWFSEVMNPSNNAYGAALIARNALGSQVSGAVQNKSEELRWANGINSSRGSCKNLLTTAASSVLGKSPFGATSLAAVALNSVDPCFGVSIQTPGTIIDATLKKALGSGIDTLVSAHTFDEIIGSVLSQMVGQVLGTGGLIGTSNPSPTTGGSSFFNQTDPTQSSTNSSLGSTFLQTVSGQLAQIRTFQGEWQTILTAAQAAQTAISNSTCYANGPQTLASTIQPVITQATTQIAKAQSSITALTAIQAEIPTGPGAIPTTAQIAQASAEYTSLTTPSAGTPSTIPTLDEVSYALEQSAPGDASAGTPSLLTQMNQIAQTAQSCSVTH